MYILGMMQTVTFLLVRRFKNTILNTESGQTSCLTFMHFHYPDSKYHIYQNIRLPHPHLKYSENVFYFVCKLHGDPHFSDEVSGKNSILYTGKYRKNSHLIFR
jgi:hypothetical protein